MGICVDVTPLGTAGAFRECFLTLQLGLGTVPPSQAPCPRLLWASPLRTNGFEP